MSAERHFTVMQVRRAFALEGLRFSSTGQSGSSRDGLIILGTRQGPLVKPLSVAVYGPEATVYFSTTMHGYHARVGNVAVSYGGRSSRLRARIEAAVANLAN